MYPIQSTPPVVQLADKLDETQVSPGILGFVVFALLGGAVWLLLKSMTRHMKRIDFEEEPAPPGEEPRGGTSGPSPSPDGGPGTGSGQDEPVTDGEPSATDPGSPAADRSDGDTDDRPESPGDERENRDGRDGGSGRAERAEDERAGDERAARVGQPSGAVDRSGAPAG